MARSSRGQRGRRKSVHHATPTVSSLMRAHARAAWGLIVSDRARVSNRAARARGRRGRWRARVRRHAVLVFCHSPGCAWAARLGAKGRRRKVRRARPASSARGRRGQTQARAARSVAVVCVCRCASVLGARVHARATPRNSCRVRPLSRKSGRRGSTVGHVTRRAATACNRRRAGAVAVRALVLGQARSRSVVRLGSPGRGRRGQTRRRARPSVAPGTELKSGRVLGVLARVRGLTARNECYRATVALPRRGRRGRPWRVQCATPRACRLMCARARAALVPAARAVTKANYPAPRVPGRLGCLTGTVRRVGCRSWRATVLAAPWAAQGRQPARSCVASCPDQHIPPGQRGAAVEKRPCGRASGLAPTAIVPAAAPCMLCPTRRSRARPAIVVRKRRPPLHGKRRVARWWAFLSPCL